MGTGGKSFTEEEINAISQKEEYGYPESVSLAIGPLAQKAVVGDDFSQSFENVAKVNGLYEGIVINNWRALYLARSFYLVGFVLYATIVILILCAVGLFSISDVVIVTLLTTTLAHVLGILFVAFKWLYKQA